MSDKGEVFVSIDTVAIEAILAQLQGAGTGGMGGGGLTDEDKFIKAEIGRLSVSGGASFEEIKRKSEYFLDEETGNGALEIGMLPSIARPLRTVVGMAFPGGYGAVREYNILRWGQRGLNEAFKLSESGAAMDISSVMLMAAAPILMAVQIKRMYEELAAIRDSLKREMERMAGINGDVYDRWLKIQSDPLLRRNI